MDSMVKAGVGLVIFFAVMIGMGLLYKKLALNSRLAVKSSKYIQSIDRYILANDKWIEVIKVDDQILMLGITNHSITEIKSFDKEELRQLDQNKEQMNFANLLKRYTHSKDNQ